MKFRDENGSFAIPIVIIAALTSLLTLMNLSKKVEQSIGTEKVRRLSLEAEELALYSFTVVKQLFSNSSGQAGLGLVNSLDPIGLSGIDINQLSGGNSTKVKLISTGELTVFGPDLLAQETSNMNSMFELADFSKLDKGMTAINLRIIDFETYPSGYGVKNLIFESKVTLNLNKANKIYTSRARIPIPLPSASCQITVQGKVVADLTMSIKQTTSNQTVAINANCSGDLIAANLDLNQVQVSESILPKIIKPVFLDSILSAPGQYEIVVRAIRVDESISESPPLILTIEAPEVDSTKPGCGPGP